MLKRIVGRGCNTRRTIHCHYSDSPRAAKRTGLSLISRGFQHCRILEIVPERSVWTPAVPETYYLFAPVSEQASRAGTWQRLTWVYVPQTSVAVH